MKINWGTGIVIAFACFISFILFFVIRMNIDHKAGHDLVTEEYYQAELGFQKEIDAENNANDDAKNIEVKKTPEGLVITFPKNIDNKAVKGIVSLYRPSNKHLDFDFPISLSDSHLLVPDKRLLEGRWDIKISWKYQDKAYLHKEKITY
ncbi:FixH family protein [Cellulophaga sp. E16_2]|uniref:FixH family protein n=1 Tax=Cellulophaga algicola (strain DSM 14237 / IC166 / ACAM 630) TaxID=688270 RepID=E6XF18_CELAD|nr:MULTISPECIES: FixH family protein [Cellulophaga]ADV49240.1 FixH family protein [Cellulophaga algicola DSM 14237]MBO0591706.1 FixH family protein [Cellulophaga sp. E16_2]